MNHTIQLGYRWTKYWRVELPVPGKWK